MATIRTDIVRLIDGDAGGETPFEDPVDRYAVTDANSGCREQAQAPEQRRDTAAQRQVDTDQSRLRDDRIARTSRANFGGEDAVARPLATHAATGV